MNKTCKTNPDHIFNHAPDHWKFCYQCGAELQESKEPIATTMYMHSSKESMIDVGEDIGLSEEAMKTFIYTGNEIKLEIRVHPLTGVTKCYAVNGVGLIRPIKI